MPQLFRFKARRPHPGWVIRLRCPFLMWAITIDKPWWISPKIRGPKPFCFLILRIYHDLPLIYQQKLPVRVGFHSWPLRNCQGSDKVNVFIVLRLIWDTRYLDVPGRIYKCLTHSSWDMRDIHGYSILINGVLHIWSLLISHLIPSPNMKHPHCMVSIRCVNPPNKSWFPGNVMLRTDANGGRD